MAVLREKITENSLNKSFDANEIGTCALVLGNLPTTVVVNAEMAPKSEKNTYPKGCREILMFVLSFRSNCCTWLTEKSIDFFAIRIKFKRKSFNLC